jgi:hypothetical protein
LLMMLKMFADSYSLAGVFALIDTAIWSLNVFATTLLVKQAREAWRTSGNADNLGRDAALVIAGANKAQNN